MDYKTFFDAVRNDPFAGSFDEFQLHGMNALITSAKACRIATSSWLAYGFATTFWETARTMQAIDERGDDAYFERMYDRKGERPGVAAQLGNVRDGDGARYHGAGLVQLTGRGRYRRATDGLRAAGVLRPGDDLEASPHLAKDPIYAGAILWLGMRDGWFTGKRFSDYLDGPVDYVDARRIINGTDHASQIAGFAHAFERALVNAAAQGTA